MNAAVPLPAQIRPPFTDEQPGGSPAEPASVLLPGHDVPLGRYTTVRRLLPHRRRRMVGAWCFVDHFGPDDVADRPGMRVPPHPHIGLQTVTWLVAGEILHRDSLGNSQSIRPGQLNVMTSGRGIAHSENSPPEHPPSMHGVQLWIALPESARHGAPDFRHHAEIPTARLGDLTVDVLVGSLAGARSPAVVHSPLLGTQLTGPEGAAGSLPLDPAYEHGVLAMSGTARVGDADLAPGSLLYLEAGRTELAVTAGPDCRLLLLGGEPFADPLVMWWNFVGRTHEDIVEAREDWAAGRRYGTVFDDPTPVLAAPPMPTTRLKARDRNGVTSG
ncbi:pirin family protein [Plantactinospora sp. GCM10030261]|uniref:pirin family protein n=1 Tax=Plantactinospora sp. GCM10030261 TaxID=3273420 RepID=UPI0036234AE2